MIPARVNRRAKREEQETEIPKTRVAAYCRVSTDSDEQATSYEMQVEHYTEYISKNPGWELAGIYADDGISGTNTKKREDFNRMIEDCMAGKIDFVISKSISRFARNTLDCLQYIRQLKDKGIAVFFEKENINTMDTKGELLLTIMASLAQQESESLSQNVKLGLQFRYQAGKVQVNHNRFLGYTKDDDGNLIIEPTEAAVIKRIYREYMVTGVDISHVLNWQDKAIHTFGKAYLFAICIGSLLIYFLSVIITNPIKQLTTATKKIAGGEYGQRVQVSGKDEVGQLADNFNQMADEIEDRIEMLSDSVRQKEDFVSNFAHELKTPLTSIIGYANRIYQKDLPREEQKQAAWYIWNEGMRLEALSLKLMDLSLLRTDDFVLQEMEASAIV